jgi:hypothetical protein
MRLSRKMRNLSSAEKALAKDVFGNSLPNWERIFITDGLGPIPGYDNPFADEILGVFRLNLGPEIYPDATKTKYYNGYGRYDAIFIHEMTHVWQYHKGYWVVLRSAWANSRFGAGYEYKSGDTWDSYNVEQQAHLVEDWYMEGKKKTDSRFIYIDKIIRPG